jgi:hypothetical protein
LNDKGELMAGQEQYPSEVVTKMKHDGFNFPVADPEELLKNEFKVIDMVTAVERYTLSQKIKQAEGNRQPGDLDDDRW